MGIISSLKEAFSKPYKTVSVAEAKDLLSSGASLIDVRSAQEWRSGRAPQAKHIPLDRLQTSTAGIQKNRPDRDVPVRGRLRFSGPVPRYPGLRGLLPARRHERLDPRRPPHLNATGLEEVIQAVKNLDMDKLRADAAQQQP